MAFRDYLATEVAEDWTDGLISRREALRRLVKLGLSASAAGALLAACADAARPAATSPAASSPGSILPASPAPASALPAVGETIKFVIHENRGLTDHIRSVASRLAGDGYSSLAIDLLSEEGGTAALGDSGNVSAVLAGASTERLVGDMKSGLDELERRTPGAKLGTMGFCFGGGMV